MDSRREKAIAKAREKLHEPAREQHLIIATRFLEDERSGSDNNLERFKDWYSIHFPELTTEIDSEKLVQVLEKGVEKQELNDFSSLAEDSKGSPLTDEQRDVLETVSEYLRAEKESLDVIQEFVENEAQNLMPSVSELLGPKLAARILAIAGSLENLSRMASSSVQVLGAENALFQHLRGGGSSPKHGILFTHRYVQNLPENERGKMARFLANKTVIAARVDHYGNGDKGDELREEAREKFEELKS